MFEGFQYQIGNATNIWIPSNFNIINYITALLHLHNKINLHWFISDFSTWRKNCCRCCQTWKNVWKPRLWYGRYRDRFHWQDWFKNWRRHVSTVGSKHQNFDSKTCTFVRKVKNEYIFEDFFWMPIFILYVQYFYKPGWL